MRMWSKEGHTVHGHEFGKKEYHVMFLAVQRDEQNHEMTQLCTDVWVNMYDFFCLEKARVKMK